MTPRHVVAADLTWRDGRLEPALAVWVDGDGRIARVGACAEAEAAAAAGAGDGLRLALNIGAMLL
ncbi:MAG TPA: hypothetical protein VFS60_09725, partial [Thermoanaerobaculia bacterium]|nr:hypothetical protein [Thermoanaerobaculia bacterium]